MVGKRDEEARASFLIAGDEFFGLPVEEGPLGAEVFEAEARRVTVVVELIFVLAMAFDVHLAAVPVAGLGNALGAPVGPDAELGVLIPLGGFVLQQRFPGGLIGSVAGE